MNNILEKEYELNPAQQQFLKKTLSPIAFWLFLLTNVPAGWIAGMRLRKLERAKAITSVPFKFLNKNPFKSIYFAVQSMAAELSTAALVLLHTHGHKPSIAYIIIDLKATFPKKATGRTFFTCEEGHKVQEAVQRCLATGEPTTVDLKTVGKMTDATIVAEFVFTWSLKQRSG